MKLKYLIVCFFLVLAGSVAAQDSVVTNVIGMKFVLIKPGSMIVGKFEPAIATPQVHSKISDSIYAVAIRMAKDAATPGFPVTLDRSYYIGKFEVTQAQWRKVMGNNPSAFNSITRNNCPAENVTWEDAQAFVAKLNALDRKHHYRLPTEFEWEYAARAGEKDDISWDDIRKSAVLEGTAPAEVGTKIPNAWGLYDMLGNVWEWVSDIYNEKMFADSVPVVSGKEHVLKGSSFTGDVKNATYMTHAGGPGNGFDVGLRIVRDVQ